MTTIESKKESSNAWDTLKEMAGSIEAPEDWSQQHAHYLYGTPKQNQENEYRHFIQVGFNALLI